MAVQLSESFNLSGDELGLDQAEDIKTRGTALIDRTIELNGASEEPVRVDLAGLERANSVTVAVLMAWYRYAALRQRSIMFVNLSQELLNIIEFSGLRSLLVADQQHRPGPRHTT